MNSATFHFRSALLYQRWQRNGLEGRKKNEIHQLITRMLILMDQSIANKPILKNNIYKTERKQFISTFLF